MIFNNGNVDIDLNVKKNIVVEQWNISSSAKQVTTLVGLNISDATKILEKQGFKRMGDTDPF